MINLMHGDCLELMKDIPDGSVDMILCDLPYGTVSCSWDVIIPFAPLWEQYKRVTKKNAAIILTAQTPFDKALGSSNMAMLRHEWIWIKECATGGMNANKMPLKKHENVLVFYKSLPTYNPQFTSGKPYKISRNKPKTTSAYGKTGVCNGFESINTGLRYPVSTLEFKRDTIKLHPTQKPVALMEYLIRTYTNEGETVLDNCAGSFTTGVACVNLNRKFIGIEKEKSYFDIGTKRIKERMEWLDSKTELMTGTGG